MASASSVIGLHRRQDTRVFAASARSHHRPARHSQRLLGTHTATLDRSFWTSLDFLISSLQSASSRTQKGWLQGRHGVLA